MYFVSYVPAKSINHCVLRKRNRFIFNIKITIFLVKSWFSLEKVQNFFIQLIFEFVKP